MKQHNSYQFITWNVNSVRTRLQHVLEFLREYAPDVVMLQELKVETDKFPSMEIEELGYNCAVYGQKTYNGVAILSKGRLEDVVCGLHEEDEQARYIEALTTLDGQVYRVVSVYVPNGMDTASEKFAYKLRFYDWLKEKAVTLLSYEERLIIGGDYNVAYLPQDVHNPSRLDGTVCYNAAEREKLRSILNLGLYDAYRLKHAEEKGFSWWDYRGASFAQDHGLRIDHLLLSPEAADVLQSVDILRDVREKEKPSDHAPVRCILRA